MTEVLTALADVVPLEECHSALLADLVCLELVALAAVVVSLVLASLAAPSD